MNDPTPTGSIDGRRSALRARAEDDTPVPAELLGAAAFSSVLANEPAEVGAALATRALHAAGEKPSASLVARTTFTLLVAERFEQVRPVIDDSIVQARRAGDSGRLSAALASRAWLALRRGDLFGAETDARTALAAAELPAPPVYRALNGGILLKALIDQGRLESADELAGMFDSEAEGKSITAAVLRLARCRLRLEQGRATEGLSDSAAVGELLTSARIESPAISRGARRQPMRSSRSATIRRPSSWPRPNWRQRVPSAPLARSVSQRARPASRQVAFAVSPCWRKRSAHSITAVPSSNADGRLPISERFCAGATNVWLHALCFATPWTSRIASMPALSAHTRTPSYAQPVLAHVASS